MKNRIVSALADRIYEAWKVDKDYEDRHTFRVIIVIPLKGEFNGDFDGKGRDSFFLRENTRLTYESLFNKKYSLKERLIHKGGRL